ncbi:MAG: hypothetical protein IJE97_16780 [Thermoguttaceae bacterium]|nr:hypothetical protein [Thermoguttaceae bacterium]MBQ9800834.1 hypothetical protein [Thermoguttaceae bacterium]
MAAKKMGRPRKEKTTRRCISMSFYATPDEALAIARAKALVDPDDKNPTSAFIREIVLERARRVLQTNLSRESLENFRS